MPAEGIFSFNDFDGATKITISMEVKIGGFFKLTEPLVVRMFKRQVEADYANLKELLESQS